METGAYVIANGEVDLLVNVDALNDVLEQKGGKPFYFKPVILVQGPGRLHIQMNVSVRFLSAPTPPVGDKREWDTQFCQGGLPCLGKQRP